MTTVALASPIAPRHAAHTGPLIYRELLDAPDVVALLRLRHRVYFEERGYGAVKPMGLDLTAHDARSRLFGVFKGAQLVGGVRFVFRHEQRIAPVVRGVHAVVGSGVRELPGASLPSEEAFDLRAALGPRTELVDLEAGRLIVLRPGVGRGVVKQLMIATLAIAHLCRCRFYLYSCNADLALRYARVTNPRWVLNDSTQRGIQSDAFAFPSKSVAAVAAVEDSPFLEQALRYARDFAVHGAISLVVDAHAEVAP